MRPSDRMAVGNRPEPVPNSWLRVLLVSIQMVLMFLMVRVACGQDVHVNASVSSDTVGVQDQFRLTITVSGSDSGDAAPPSLRALQGFQVVQGPDTSSQFEWVNGRTSSSKSFSYTLLPQKEGQFTIEPIEVRIGGKSYKTQPIPVHVTSGSTGRRPGSGQRSANPFLGGDEDVGAERRNRIGENEVFVTADLDHATAYSGQQVTLSYHLFTKISITGLQLQDNPPLTGFWVENLDVPTNPTGARKTINGEEYLEYTVKKQALFATTVGTLKIPPSTFAVSVRTPGDFFGFLGQSETIYRKTRDVLLEVKPLPADNRPADFTNAVGAFNLTSSLDKTEAATGEAVALRVKLEGRGNLKMIPDVVLPRLGDFTVYSAKRSDNVRPFQDDVIGGDKSWEYVIVPKAPGQQTIPALTFSYFNPDRGKYETTSTHPLGLIVSPGTDGRSSPTDLSGINKQNLTRQGTDINFIKLSAGDLRTEQGPPVYRTFWFCILAGVPLIANAGIFLYQQKRSKESTNMVVVRRRRARHNAILGLKKAEKAGKLEPRRFYDEAALSLSRYLSDRFTIPEIEVTTDTIERTLAEKSVGQETVKEALACLQECDFGRFVSASASASKMSDLTARIRRVIDTMERT